MQESFRAIKGILNIREQGQSLEKKVYCYVIYGNKGMYAMGFRFLEGQDAPVSLTSDWSEFASYVASSWKDPEGTYVSVIKNTVKHFFENTHLKNLYEGSRDGERNLEQKLNMSLDKNLGYSAFSFLKIQKCPGSMVREFLKQFGDPSVLEVVEEEVEEDLQDEEPKTTQDVLHEFIPCSPVIDPVKGKSVASLALGEKLTVKLPQDNKLYKALSRARGGYFDGSVPGTLLRMEEKGNDRFILEVGITDRIRGLLILQRSLRVRLDKEEGTLENASGFDFSLLLPYLAAGALAVGIVILLFWIYQYLTV